MKRLTIGLLALFVLAMSVPQPASAEFYIGEAEGIKVWMSVHTVGAMQSLDQSNNSGSLADLDSLGFHTAFGNIAWRATFDEYVEMYWDATMASRVINNAWWGHEGWLIVHQVPESSPVAVMRPLFDEITLKAGHFDIAFGNQINRKSLNADVQRNPLIGNYVISPQATEPGIEIYTKDHWPVRLLAGFGAGSSTGGFTDDAREFSYHGKIWGDILPNLSAAASFYTVDQSGVASPFTNSHLFSVERLGGRYSGVFGDGDAPGNVLPGAGKDETAWVLDMTWEPTSMTTVNALFGNVTDDDTNNVAAGTPSDDWNYYGADVTHYLTESVYLAGRYSVADAQELSSNSNNDGEVERIQLGMGTWLTNRALLKVEWVDESVSGFQAGTTNVFGTGIDAGQDPEFDGVIAEFSVSL